MPIIYELLRDDYSFEQAESIQLKYQKIIEKEVEKINILDIKKINCLVGVDVSYYKKDNYEFGVACAVLWNLDKNKIENYYITKDNINFPYKSGFLGFRECKILSKTISKLPNWPDLIICDGHGRIHPRRFGEAVHLGLALNIASIGIAKNPFIGYSNWKEIDKIKGNKSPVWLNNPNIRPKNTFNELLGYAVCLHDGLKPVFISEGYKINLDIALRICLKAAKGHRQPEPLYLADFYSREEIKKHL